MSLFHGTSFLLAAVRATRATSRYAAKGGRYSSTLQSLQQPATTLRLLTTCTHYGPASFTSVNLIRTSRVSARIMSSVCIGRVHAHGLSLKRKMFAHRLETSSECAEHTDASDSCSMEDLLQFNDCQFGLLFDCDGVLTRGTKPIPDAVRMMRLLVNKDKEFRLPVAFVTNACGSVHAKAKTLSDLLDVHIHADQVLHAETPLRMYNEYHHKRVLVVGQGDIVKVAKDLGFQNVATLEDVQKAYPQLDMVDHNNRRRLSMGMYEQRAMDPIEAVVLLGEPAAWESNLQLLVDVLTTNGKPDHKPTHYPEEHIPVLAANLDLVFMHEACLPRFGHGAFLVCLEALYLKVTGHKMKYTAITGKPSEITMRYAEHVISWMNEKLGNQKPIQRLYLIGDNPDTDIVSANLYRRYVQSLRPDENGNDEPDTKYLPQSRRIPDGAKFLPQTVENVEGILVGTGIFNPLAKEHLSHSHESFPLDADLLKPSCYQPTCYDAINYIFTKEGLLLRNDSDSD